MKLLFWLVLGWGVVWALRKSYFRMTGAQRPGSAQVSRDRGAEPMVRCEHCHVYLPASEAVLDASSEAFCCEAHRTLHRP